ncbi:MAG: PspA-associated protein PspAA [Nocardioidaceae bacterium]
MIIRILSEGQFDVPDEAIDGLNELDAQLGSAIDASDEATFSAALGALLDRVREVGDPVAVDALVPSQLMLPSADAELAEVRDLLSGDGLIPG